MRWIVADTETTGLSADSKMVEVAWARIDEALELVEWDATLLNPRCPIPAAASAVHNIFDEHVGNSPTAEQYFYGQLDGRWYDEPMALIAHNAAFDARYLAHFMPDDTVQVCTWRLARKLYPGLGSYKLGALAQEFDLLDEDDRLHSAEGDLNVVMRLLRKIRDDHGLSLGEMLATSLLPIQVDTMPFGKHKDMKLHELPSSYIRWLLGLPDLDKDLRGALLAL